MTNRRIEARLVVSCEILLDDEAKSLAEHECGKDMTDEEAAKRVLYSFLNPKVLAFNDQNELSGSWDMVCDYEGRMKKFHLDLR